MVARAIEDKAKAACDNKRITRPTSRVSSHCALQITASMVSQASVIWRTLNFDAVFGSDPQYGMVPGTEASFLDIIMLQTISALHHYGSPNRLAQQLSPEHSS